MIFVYFFVLVKSWIWCGLDFINGHVLVLVLFAVLVGYLSDSWSWSGLIRGLSSCMILTLVLCLILILCWSRSGLGLVLGSLGLGFDQYFCLGHVFGLYLVFTPVQV